MKHENVKKMAALALLAAGCTLHMRLRNRFIDQL